MKEKRSLLVVMILSGLLGWVGGFLRLPYFEKNASFGLGLLAGLCLAMLLLVLMGAWNKDAAISRWIGRAGRGTGPEAKGGNYRLLGLLLTTFVVLGGLIGAFLLYRQNTFFNTRAYQRVRAIQEAEIFEANQISNLASLMNNILNKVDRELEQSLDNKLSDETIGRIAALSYSFKPYRYLTGDSLSVDKLSPERGQLLLALSNMKMDSSSFDQIKRRTSFAAADLREADLRRMDLTRIDLEGAALDNANLRETKLNNAKLRGAKMWATNLSKCELQGADLRAADLRWGDLNEADLRKANLEGANLTSAKLNNADLGQALIKWAILDAASLNAANLTDAILFWTSLRRANLSHSNFSNADLRRTNLSEANFDEAILSGARLSAASVAEKEWLEKLEEWKVTGTTEIQNKYKVTPGKTIQKLKK